MTRVADSSCTDLPPWHDVSGESVAALLDLIEEARGINGSDEELYALVEEAVNRGIYPEPKGENNSVLWMVEGWGARWHIWEGRLNCPLCQADLRNHDAGPPFRREIALYDSDRDRTTGHKCPDCGGTW